MGDAVDDTPRAPSADRGGDGVPRRSDWKAELPAIDGRRAARQARPGPVWTYSCINWLRTLPYVRAWAERYHGEGDYEQSEGVIQQLLAEAGTAAGSAELVEVAPSGVEAAADWATLRSLETYVGYARAENFSSPGGAQPDRSHVYSPPDLLRLNSWALSGDWTVGEQAALVNVANGQIVQRFFRTPGHVAEHTFEITFLDAGVRAYVFTFG